MSSMSKEWSQDLVFPHPISSVKCRGLHLNGRFFWLGHGAGIELDGIEGSYLLSYDPHSRLISRDVLTITDHGTIEDIVLLDQKIGAIYRVPEDELDLTCLRLWISTSDVIPRSNLVMLEIYQDVPGVHKLVGFVGRDIFCADEYCMDRGRKRELLCLFGGYFRWERIIEGGAPRRFYINYVTAHYHSICTF